MKRVVEDDGSRMRDPKRIIVSRLRRIKRDRNNMCFSKVVVLAFMAMVVNCTAGMESKSQRIDVVVAAADKYLGVLNFPAEELQDVLNDSVPSSQAAGLE